MAFGRPGQVDFPFVQVIFHFHFIGKESGKSPANSIFNSIQFKLSLVNINVTTTEKVIKHSNYM